KQRTVLLADLATAHLDDAGHAAALVDQALDVLTDDWYATGHQRIGQVAHRLPAAADKDRVVERHRALAKAGWQVRRCQRCAWRPARAARRASPTGTDIGREPPGRSGR